MVQSSTLSIIKSAGIDAIGITELGKGVFEGSPDCVKLLDAEGHILAMNRNGQCAMEIDDFRTVQGAEWSTLWVQENRHEIDAAIAAARAGHNYTLNLACPTAKGTPRWWNVTVSPIPDDAGEVVRILAVSRDVTEARFAAEKIRLSEERFRSLVTATASIVWGMPGTGQFDAEQPGWFAFTGQAFDEMKGPGWLDGIHIDDRNRTAQSWEQAVSEKKEFEAEHRLRRADGEFRHMSMRAVPIKAADGNVTEWVGVHTDIHNRIVAEQVIHENQERVRLATESAELGLWAWHPNVDAVIWENDRPYEIFGLSKDAPAVTAERFAKEFIHPDHLVDFENAVKKTLETGARLHFQSRIKRPDGQTRWIEFFGSLQPQAGGDPLRIIGTVADITNNKSREEELRRLAATLSEADRRKTEFLAVLAHELRNPLAPIKHGLQLMRTQSSNSAIQEKVRDMLDRQVNQMVRLVDDLLDVARITSGKVELRKQRTHMGDLVRISVETSMPLIEASGHHLTINVPDEFMPVYVDPERISQVISNLLNNAAKYTPYGGKIVLDVTREEGEITVSVTDNGVGIAPKSIESVFDLFRQVGQDIERSQGGLGIGLSLVRQLIELHGGTTFAKSPGEGGGSTFMFFLKEADVPTATALQGGQSPTALGLKPLRILIADDNVDAAEIMSLLLEVSGHTTYLAHDGEVALKKIRELQPDIAFLDIGMPAMNGYEVAKAVRAIHVLNNVMLVALTGWGSEHDRLQSQKSGFNSHLIKPVDMNVIEKLIAETAAAGGRPTSC